MGKAFFEREARVDRGLLDISLMLRRNVNVATVLRSGYGIGRVRRPVVEHLVIDGGSDPAGARVNFDIDSLRDKEKVVAVGLAMA